MNKWRSLSFLCGLHDRYYTSPACRTFGENSVRHDESLVFVFGDEDVGDGLELVIDEPSLLCFVIKQTPFFEFIPAGFDQGHGVMHLPLIPDLPHGGEFLGLSAFL
jgi:hypothetical protein